ncbi:MAG: metal dependent phosphohydrolase [Firmicutes bacterium]|nr:metal dependent phosphohydrolase [Bacillota bacterium]
MLGLERMFNVPNRITLDDLHDMVDALSSALEAKNAHMCGHSQRVAELSLLMAQRIGLSPIEQERIHIGAHLHDIGKIGIPDVILNKPGKLTDSEFAIIRQHPEIGGQIVSKVKVFHSVVDIVRHHHERFDGKGYPDKLCGTEIALGARIVSVADAFDAMISMRSYRPPLNVSEAMVEMERFRGSQFDPAIVDVLRRLVNNNELECINYGELLTG